MSPVDRRRRGSSAWQGAAGYTILGIAIGAALLFVTLETLLLGLLPAAGAVWVWQRAGRHRWTFSGGVLVGIGLCAVPLLGPALTNTDPAVRYDSSTVVVLGIALAAGAGGVVSICVAAVRQIARSVRAS